MSGARFLHAPAPAPVVVVTGYDIRIEIWAPVGGTRFEVKACGQTLVEGYLDVPAVDASGLEPARCSPEAALGSALLDLAHGIENIVGSLGAADVTIACGLSSSSLDDREVIWTKSSSWEGLLHLLRAAVEGHNGIGERRLLNPGAVLKLLKFGAAADEMVKEANEDPGEDSEGRPYRSGAQEA